MATLEDKIMGEKLQNYCSSSEDEDSGDDSQSGDEEGNASTMCSARAELPPVNKWNGSATNTGPKGVLEDWKRYKQLEIETRKQLAKEQIALAQKLTLTVKTAREEEEAKAKDELDEEFKELLDEDFLMKYQQQRMQELMAQLLQKQRSFGSIITLNSQEEFLKAIDKEDTQVTIIVHIYNNSVMACESMDACLHILAADYPAVKYCRIAANVAGLSRHFHIDGVPALLVYKGGQMIGNFVKLINDLGEDFYASEVEKFLVEFGMLPEK